MASSPETTPCPKCDLTPKLGLARFCQHQGCPIRAAFRERLWEKIAADPGLDCEAGLPAAIQEPPNA